MALEDTETVLTTEAQAAEDTNRVIQAADPVTPTPAGMDGVTPGATSFQDISIRDRKSVV